VQPQQRQQAPKPKACCTVRSDESGFNVDAPRVAYLRFLRREKRQWSPAAADAEFEADVVALPKEKPLIAINLVLFLACCHVPGSVCFSSEVAL
jgi:hypothetical protein